MKNKTVIRKQNVKGQFTTIHHSILKDKRLSPNGFRLLVSILSDSDENFKLSPTVYCNRLGITKTTFLNAVINLENCGYIKREVSKVNKRKKHYTVSEFGNLKKEQSESDINESENPIEQEEASLEDISEYSDEFLDYVNTLIKLNKYEEFESLFNDEWIEKLKINTVVELKKHVDAYLVGIYKEYLAHAKNPEKHPKALKDFKDWLKKEIYINHNLDINPRSKWAQLSLVKYKKTYKTDYETELADRLENGND
jgi:DNA-binding MarR family transcriptional regulator